jgi:soluble epoxide hydrolase/lipid-phosphate phosphatase
MLGYGGTDIPQEFKEYTTKKLSDDLAALLDLIEVKKAVSPFHGLHTPLDNQ